MNNPFEIFGGLDVRTEELQEKSVLDAVLDLEGKIIDQYKDGKIFTPNKDHGKIYEILYDSIKESLKEIGLTEKTISQYINARENRTDDYEAVIRGMYSAAILEISCTENPDEEIIIDGCGKIFNYLFYYVKHASNISIQNFKGNHILGHAGNFGGNIKRVSLKNIEGDYTLGTLAENGNAEYLILNQIRGDNTLWYAGSRKGDVKHLVIENITGYNTLCNAAIESGTLKHVYLRKVKGNNTLQVAGCNNGNIEYLNLHTIEGDGTLRDAGNFSGSMKKIILNDVLGYDTLRDIGISNGTVENIFREHEVNEHQKSILSQIQTIVETMHTLSSEEQTKAHDQIARLQIEIFAGEK